MYTENICKFLRKNLHNSAFITKRYARLYQIKQNKKVKVDRFSNFKSNFLNTARMFQREISNSFLVAETKKSSIY